MAETTTSAATGARDPWREAHESARALHDALLAIGIPDTVLTPMCARQNGWGEHHVVIPPLPIPDAGRLLAGLGPSLRPQDAHLPQPGPAL